MARGQVTIKTVNPGPGLAITAWLGEGGPIPTGGYGGWEVVPRPRRVAMTQWRGREPIQMDLPLVIDSYDGKAKSKRLDESIELVVTRLERMALPYKNGEPPKVKLTGSATNLVPHDDLTWIIQGFEFANALRTNDGNRVRQEVTVALISFVDVEKVKISAAKKVRQRAGRA